MWPDFFENATTNSPVGFFSFQCVTQLVSLFLAYHQVAACVITLLFVWTNNFPCDTFHCCICFKLLEKNNRRMTDHSWFFSEETVLIVMCSTDEVLLLPPLAGWELLASVWFLEDQMRNSNFFTLVEALWF